MYLLNNLFLLLSLSISFASASTSLVYQYPSVSSWLENLVVLDNGKLIVTRTDLPQVDLVDPKAKTAVPLLTFPNATGISGIVKVGDCEYAVTAATINLQTFVVTNNSNIVFTFKLDGDKASLYKSFPIPEAGLLDGIAHSKKNDDIVFIADAFAGLIWKLNIKKGGYSVILDDPSLKPGFIPFGINGIRTKKDFIYYTNTPQGTLYKVPYNGDGTITGGIITVASTGGLPLDDFIIGNDGVAYLATNAGNVILKEVGGAFSVIAGSANSSEVAGNTAVKKNKKGTGLYVVTCGAKAAPVNGTFIEPAKIVEVKF